MNKRDLAKAISGKSGLAVLPSQGIVQKTIDAIVDSLIAQRRIELRGFGVFEVKKRAARNGRNPRTGERVFVPEKFVVTFVPGSQMKARVQSIESREGGVADAA